MYTVSMKILLTIIAIGFAQKYLGWGDWLWYVLGGVVVLNLILGTIESIIDSMIKKYENK